MKSLKLNKDILGLKESATLAINLKAIAKKANGEKVYHWGFGQSPFPVPLIIQNELKQRTMHKEYLPTAGLQELRKTLSEYYTRVNGINFNPECILIGPGSKELMFQLFYLLEGDFIIPAPSWVSYVPQLATKGKKANILQTKRENNYKVTPEQLDLLCSELGEGQKTLVLNSPANPTGQAYTDKEYQALTRILEKYEIIVLADEIYSEVCFTQDKAASLTEFYPARTIVTGGLSKAHSAGGYRLGYMAIPSELIEIVAPLKAFISETFSAVSAPIQYCAIKAWDGTIEVKKEVELFTKIHQIIGNYYFKRFNQMKVDCPKADGAFYLFVDFSHYAHPLAQKGISTCQQLCDYLLEQLGIAILPGDDFYFPKESLTARVAFVDYNGADLISKLADHQDLKESSILAYCPQIQEGLDLLEQHLQGLV